MYNEYWRLTRAPFENTPDPEFLYESAAHKDAVRELMYAIEQRKGAALLTGEYGSGKTLLSRWISQRLLRQGGYKVALVTHPSLTPSQILKEILYQLIEEEFGGEKQRVIHRLQNLLYEAHAGGKSVVVIIDEAQVLRGQDVLDELRMLLNFQLNDRFLITLLLLGQPELREKVDRYPQLRQRLAVRYHLPNLTGADVGGYIAHRMAVAHGDPAVFAPDAVAAIASASGGCPREINTLCDLSLFRGSQQRLTCIGAQTIEDLVRERART